MPERRLYMYHEAGGPDILWDLYQTNGCYIHMLEFDAGEIYSPHHEARGLMYLVEGWLPNEVICDKGAGCSGIHYQSNARKRYAHICAYLWAIRC